MDYQFDGLPLHVLLVHVVIVAVPLLAVLLVVLSAWPGARRVLWLPVLLAATALVPLTLTTISAGEWLELRVPLAPLIQEHTAQGDSITPWVWALLAIAVIVAVWAIIERFAARRTAEFESTQRADDTTGRPADAPPPARGRPLPRGAAIAVGVVLTVASIGVGAMSTWTLVEIGESGSRAVWEGSFSDEPLER